MMLLGQTSPPRFRTTSKGAMYRDRFYRKWWIHHRVMYIWHGKLNTPGFDNIYRDRHSWEIVYKIASFSITIGRDYHVPCGERCCR
jgi:hypothetical protein